MKKIVLLTSFFACTFFGNTQEVTTLAGSTAGFADGTGTAAQFDRPMGVAVDAAGNVYVADIFNHRIRKITPAGVVSTFAGSAPGYADGTGTEAKFVWPRGVATDSEGNMYVADEGNSKIRKITPAGVVSTLAGSTPGYADGIGTAAQFNHPYGVATDAAGNVYVADTYNLSIRKITPTGVVSTLVTPISVGGGLATDNAGNLYVAGDMDTATSVADYTRIKKISPTGVLISFFEGFAYPNGVTTDAAGNVYVADRSTRIKKITPAGVVSTLAGSTVGYADGTGTAARFNNPSGVATDTAGNVYVADTGNNRIRKITVQPLGINDQFQESTTFKAYPNPFKDLLKIQSIGQYVYSYRLSDLTGKQVLSGNYNDTANSGINTSRLPKGVYILSLTAEGKTQNIKVVKE